MLSLAMSSAMLVASQTHDSFKRSSAVAHVEEDLRRTMGRVNEELLGVVAASLWPVPETEFGAEDFEYQLAVGATAGVADWGPPRRLAFEYQSGEVDDGVDNNGNGLVDEGILVLEVNPDEPEETRVVLATGVAEYLEGEVPDGDDDNGNGVTDERGFNVHLSGELLWIRLSLQAVDEDGNQITRSMETAFRVRN